MAPVLENFEARIFALMAHADVYLPAESGRLPTIVQLHGCGGKKPFQRTWAEQARAAGWAAVVVDSYAHRRISRMDAYATVCTGLRLWGRERAGDLFAALEWCRRQNWCDPQRLAVAGWSHGGWTALDAMALRPGAEAERATRLAGLPPDPLAGLVGAFVVYPYLGYGSLAAMRGLHHRGARVRAIVGGRDVIVGDTRAALGRLGAETTFFESATHAFDEPDAADLRVRYNATLTRRAHALYREFLNACAG